MSEEIWDIIPTTGGSYTIMASGTLEHTFRLGLTAREDIRLVRIPSEGMLLRYSIPVGCLDADRQRTIDKVEAWIAKTYKEDEDGDYHRVGWELT